MKSQLYNYRKIAVAIGTKPASKMLQLFAVFNTTWVDDLDANMLVHHMIACII